MSNKLINEIKDKGFSILKMEKSLQWEAVLRKVSNLIDKKPFKFDGTADCYGVNYVELGKGNYRSAKNSALGLHQEGYESQERPEYIAFYCVHSIGEGGETLVADSQPIISDSSSNFVKELNFAEIRFCKVQKQNNWTPWRQLIEENQRRIIRFAEPETNFRCVEVRKTSSSLVDQLTILLKQNTVTHAWKDGEVLIIDNLRCLHGRNKIGEQARRCLLRLAF